MERYFKKHSKSLDSLAIKMIDEDIHKAVELCEASNPEYLKYLAKAKEKIEDYFEEKNIQPETLI